MNTIYPFNLLNEEIFPLFGGKINGFPLFIDLSKDNEKVDTICNQQTQKEFNNYVFGEMSKNNTDIAVSGYLEDRTTLLKKYPQMVMEKRIYHLGVDVMAPLGTDLYAPVDGEVVLSEYEEGDGNYGGMVILKHNVNGIIFYSLYGHLNRNALPPLNSILKKGEKFAKIGDFDENGNWFYHTHIQVFTEKGYNNGWIHKGYCSPNDIAIIDKYCPNPIFLLRF